MRFEVVVRSPDGLLGVRLIDAGDAAQARTLAGQDGAAVLGQAVPAVRQRGRSLDLGSRLWRNRFDHGRFAQDLASLLQAGLGILEAIEALAQSDDAGAGSELMRRLAVNLREGLTLSAAMRAQAEFPPLLVAAVQASERTGDMVDALQRHAQHDRQVQALRARLLGAATYPLLLLAVGGGVVLFLLGFVVPRFAVLIESSRASLPWASRWLMNWGQAVAAHPALVAAVLCLLLGALAWAALRLRHGVMAGLWQRLPLVGSLTRQFRLAQTYRTAGMLVRGGVPVVQAMAQCVPLLHGRERKALEDVLARVREGVALSAAMARAELADAMTQRMLLVAERSGSLAEMLERIAEGMELRLQRTLDVVSRWIEPLLMILIGLVIGAIVVLMYLPIFDLASQLQ